MNCSTCHHWNPNHKFEKKSPLKLGWGKCTAGVMAGTLTHRSVACQDWKKKTYEAKKCTQE